MKGPDLKVKFIEEHNILLANKTRWNELPTLKEVLSIRLPSILMRIHSGSSPEFPDDVSARSTKHSIIGVIIVRRAIETRKRNQSAKSQTSVFQTTQVYHPIIGILEERRKGEGSRHEVAKKFLPTARLISLHYHFARQQRWRDPGGEQTEKIRGFGSSVISNRFYVCDPPVYSSVWVRIRPILCTWDRREGTRERGGNER